MINDFLTELYRLSQEGKEDDAVYGIISWFDDLFKANKFDVANETLSAMEIDKLIHPSIMLSVLAGTLAAPRNKLRARDGVRVRVILELNKQSMSVEEIIELVRGL